MTEITAVDGVRRKIKERSDGTLVVEVEIEPYNKQRFLKLFPDIDMHVALAPLKVNHDSETS